MACLHTTASPTADALCFVRERRTFLQPLSAREPVHARPIGFRPPDVRTVKWAADGSQYLVGTDTAVLVVDTQDLTERVRLDTGSGGSRIAQADFIGNDKLLVVWEFGRTKLWDLNTGRALDLPDLKTIADGCMWQIRPALDNESPELLAMISRSGTEDVLVFVFPETNNVFPGVRLSCIDAQSLSWSPNGRWLAILDSPVANPNLFIHTPDGHLFRSCSPCGGTESELGIKKVCWSPDGALLASARYDGRAEILNTRTFSPIAEIEHSLTIDQRSRDAADQAIIWQENVSASNERSYTAAPQPVSLPLTRSKASTEPSELGVAEVAFSCDGSVLATSDTRTQNTVWIWSMETLSAHAVVIQHSPIRKLLWHPTRPDLLLIDCASGVAHIYDVTSTDSPRALHTEMRPKATLSWLHTTSLRKPVILVTEKESYRLLYPEGPDSDSRRREHVLRSGPAEVQEAASDVDDSLFDLLSGRTPMPQKTQPSYTEMVDLDVDAEDTADGALDDTFREKRTTVQPQEVVDPFDDSEIF